MIKNKSTAKDSLKEKVLALVLVLICFTIAFHLFSQGDVFGLFLFLVFFIINHIYQTIALQSFVDKITGNETLIFEK